MRPALHETVLLAAARLFAEMPMGEDADCCVFVRRLMELVYGAPRVNTVPLWRWHLWATDGAGPWEPVFAARDAGVVVMSMWPASMQWTMVQGWRAPVDPTRGQWPPAKGTTGHTFLWCSLGSGQGLMLDSARARGPRLAMRAEPRLYEEFKGGMSMAALVEP